MSRYQPRISNSEKRAGFVIAITNANKPLSMQELIKICNLENQRVTAQYRALNALLSSGVLILFDNPKGKGPCYGLSGWKNKFPRERVIASERRISGNTANAE